MTLPHNFYCGHRLVTAAMLLFGTYLLSIDLKTIENRFGYSGDVPVGPNTKSSNTAFLWMNTAGVTLSHIQGDPALCKDVIYSGDSRDPFTVTDADDDKDGTKMVQRGWKSLAYTVRTLPALKHTTCYAFFKVPSPWIDQSGKELHPVWGRLPATALVMSAFPKADIFLYLDSDALLAVPDKSPTAMYNALAFDGYGENATSQQLNPGLIVNKPLTGWLCGQCESFGLGHGCFNSGVLLWHRAKAEQIVRAWWESRNMGESQNIVDTESGESFHGWAGDDAKRVGDKMGEQNRLMYLYATDPHVRAAVWPVPQQTSEEFKSKSCPNSVDYDHMPCLQNDFVYNAGWNTSKPSCFVNHYADEKQTVIDHAEMMMKHGNRLRG